MNSVNKSTLKKYQDILLKPSITEKELIGIRSFINNKLRHEQVLRIEFQNQLGEKYLEPEHQEKGINWLKKINIKKSGSHSKNCFLGQFELSVLNSNPSMMFAYLIDLGYGQISNLQPVYRVEDDKGNWFSYVGTSVQEIGSVA
jgi:hypothetical protein